MSARKQVAILRINKAQFGTAVWLNGQKIGEHAGCFSAGYFDVTRAIELGWREPPGGADRRASGRAAGRIIPRAPISKRTGGRPESTTVLRCSLSDNPVIESVQVAPRIAASQITVQTKLKNYGAVRARFVLTQRVDAWKGGRESGRAAPLRVELAPGEEKIMDADGCRSARRNCGRRSIRSCTCSRRPPAATAPATRFGMREFRFDTPTRRAYLNGRVYFLRGSNITLHRFFEDPLSGALPWNEAWVRKLLVDIPKRMHWNSFRFCIGPVPDRWLDIADEAGLLIQNEFFVWTGAPDWFQNRYQRSWNADEMIRQYGEWMRDNWNHPSVAIWDANNETLESAVRREDHSRGARPGSFRTARGRTATTSRPGRTIRWKTIRTCSRKAARRTRSRSRSAELEGLSGKGRAGSMPTGHAQINNEYGWLWLLRDGTPTELTGKVYEHLLGAGASPQDRLALDAYLLGGLTEFWRAYRNYAGVLHFVYLTACYPGAYTCDNFRGRGGAEAGAALRGLRAGSVQAAGRVSELLAAHAGSRVPAGGSP